MNERISDDDPQLTAYALGELDATERADFERRLAGDAVARARVEEIRAAAALFETALAAEPVAGSVSIARTPVTDVTRRRPSSIIRFPQFYYIVSGLAAACFAVVFFVQQSKEKDMPSGRPPGLVRHETQSMPVALPPAVPERAIAIESARLADLPEKFFTTAENSTSSFPLRVDRASYGRVREALKRGGRPRPEQVQVSEMINAFNYSWPAPAEGHAFSTVLEAAPAPWEPRHRLVRVGLKAHGAPSALVARDAQVEVDFNAARVKAWRLIGFERNGVAGVRGLSSGENLGGDAVVTALYEVLPVEASDAAADDAWLTMSLRYRDAATGTERQLAARLDRSAPAFEQASQDFQFIASVAAFGSTLKGAPLEARLTSEQIIRWAAASARGRPEREEFVELVGEVRTVVR